MQHTGHLGPRSASLARGSLTPEKERTALVWPRFTGQARSTPSAHLLAYRRDREEVFYTENSQAQKSLAV